jgi:hypothetical protein
MRTLTVIIPIDFISGQTDSPWELFFPRIAPVIWESCFLPEKSKPTFGAFIVLRIKTGYL